nr:reverse transcriptase domain-containing protein [Tanacetum cinerariifolium]
MHTRSKSYPNNSNATIPRRSNRRRVLNIVEPEIHTIEEVVLMADRSMEELLQEPTEGYGEAIVIPKILAENSEIKTNLLQLVQTNKFYGFERDNPHTHISGNILSKTTRKALKIIENKSRVHQISNLVEIVNKQVITPATAKAVEKTCVICEGAHAYYNCIATDSNQPSVCVATGTYNQVSPPNRASNQIPPPGFAPVQNHQNRFNQNQRQGNNFNRGNNFQNNQGYHASMNNALNFQNQGFQNQPFQAPNNQIQSGIPNELSSYMKSNESLVRNMQNQIDVLRGDFNKQEENLRRNLNNDMRNILGSFFQNQTSTSGTLSSNIVPNPKGEMKAVTTRSTAHIQPPVVPISIPKPDVPKIQHKPNIIYPSRLNDQKLREKSTNQMEKFFQIFHDLHFDISFADALLLMPKFASTIKSLLTNKDKLFELAKVPLNENCSAMLLKKLTEKLGDPGKFLIPCDFSRIDVCHALADLGASINLMPLSIWKKISLPELTPTRMTLELANRSITRQKRVAKDVFVKVGKFHFPTDFVVVYFEADPRVPLILRRSFLRTGRALIDVYGEEITLMVNDESVTFNLNQTMRYSLTYDDNSVNRVDIIDIACEEFVQDVLNFQYNSKSSNPTLVSNASFSEETKSKCSKQPIVKSSSPTLTPFGEKKLLNDDPFQLLSMDLKQAKETKAKSSIEEPPELELKELLSHLEYAFLEETDKLPVIIAKDLKDVEKEALIKVLKPHKRAIALKISDIKGIDPIFCTHKILMEEDYKPSVQSQRRVNPKIHDVIKKEVIKLLDAGMIYLISDSPNLNDATRKDHFSLPFIDQKLERLARNEFYCFLDGFSCDFAIGAVLGQRKTKHFQPIHYASKTMTKAQIHYTTTEKEMLVVVYAFEKFQPYLVLSKSIVYTDHSALKYLLSKQDAKPRAIISDRGTNFCNDQFARVMTKYGVTHRLATTYHPQTSGQVEVSNQGLKRILERMIGENRASWSNKLDDALWAFQHKAYWALKHVNFDLKTAGDHRKLQLNELNELRNQSYENSLISKREQIRPFTITQVFPYGTVELSQPNGPNFKVNGHRVKHYFGGDIPSKKEEIPLAKTCVRGSKKAHIKTWVYMDCHPGNPCDLKSDLTAQSLDQQKDPEAMKAINRAIQLRV